MLALTSSFSVHGHPGGCLRVAGLTLRLATERRERYRAGGSSCFTHRRRGLRYLFSPRLERSVWSVRWRCRNQCASSGNEPQRDRAQKLHPPALPRHTLSSACQARELRQGLLVEPEDPGPSLPSLCLFLSVSYSAPSVFRCCASPKNCPPGPWEAWMLSQFPLPTSFLLLL